jgi:hypothetical protein
MKRSDICPSLYLVAILDLPLERLLLSTNFCRKMLASSLAERAIGRIGSQMQKGPALALRIRLL